MMKFAAALLFALISSSALAAPGDCAPKPIDGKQVSWTGACQDGLPDGQGVLDVTVDGVVKMHYEGEVRRGIPHGKGYLKAGDGSEFEGDFVNGRREGRGVYASPWGNRYEGAMRANKPEGEGTMAYALGGSYTGQWKDGKPHGKGVAVFAGGRRFEGEFADGYPAGEAHQKSQPSGERYALRVAPRKIGILGGRENVFGSRVPYHKSYAELNEQEQESVRAMWPMLDATDTPPYPLHGTREIFEWLSKAQNERLVAGEVMMKVLVDAEGNASAVKVLASPDEALTKFVAALLMKQKYSPALCQGTPCAMAYPFSARLSIGRPSSKR